ncbi:MAG: SUMF1/EgtB/PvdO family nonheme iron enzyme [Elusimicrobia bacterium]|nr:SUMF1/EgtB/PvdO family nonheme iron enzyme [Elusimicrobiota bacterium]
MPSPGDPKFLEHFKKAAALYQKGRIEDAVQEFREAIRIDPNVAEARCNLGVALAKLGRDDEAITELEAALRIDPKHAASWYNLGMRLEAKGRGAEAIKAYANFIANASDKRRGYVDDAKSRIAALKRGQGTMTEGSGPESMILDPAGHDTPTILPDASAWVPGAVMEDLYEVRSVLGEGGFGSVYKIYHQGWGLELAVKSPREDRVANRRALERFVQEANTWVGLGLHPHITTCYFVRIIGGLPRIFIEHMEGGSLSDWLHARKVGDAKTALDIAIQIARGMEYAHSKGLVHRDLKPGNCLMAPSGALKVTDFGLAKVGGAEDEVDSAPELARGAKIAKVRESTMTGRMGTPEYMAPEQWYQAGKATRTADIWAFGVILYGLFCGRNPFKISDQEPLDVFYARMLESNWAYAAPDKLDTGLRVIIASCLKPEPGMRPGDFKPLRERLEEVYQRLVGAAYPREEVRKAPLLADALNNQGVSMADLGRKYEAERLFNEALKLDPAHPGAVHNLGLLLMEAGKAKEGDLLARLNSCKKARPADWAVCYLLGLARLRGSDAASAAREFGKAAELSRGNSMAMRALEKAKRWDFGWAGARELFVMLPRGVESAQKAEAEFKALIGQAQQAADSGRYGDAYETLDNARHIEGYERSSIALDLLQRIGLKGRRKGLVAGWHKRTFEGKAGPVLSAAFTPDGKQAVSGGADGTLRVWHVDTGQCLRTLRGHSGALRCVCMTPSGASVVSGGDDGDVRVWDLKTGACAVLKGHAGVVIGIAMLPDGAVLSLGKDRSLMLWNIKSWKGLGIVGTYVEPVNGLCVTPEGRQALTISADKTLGLYDIKSRESARAVPLERASLSLAVSPNGECVLFGSKFGSVCLWGLAAGKSVAELKGHEGSVKCVDFLDDRFALSAGDDRVLRVWDLREGRQVGQFEGHAGSVNSACFAPDGRFALSASDDGTVRLWEMEWDFEFPARSWDGEADAYLEKFIASRGWRAWVESKRLLEEFSRRGFGWLRPWAVRRRLWGKVFRRYGFRAAGVMAVLALVFSFTARYLAYKDSTRASASAMSAGKAPSHEVKPGEMALIPAGEFIMGSPEGEGAPNEHPRHKVYLDAFHMDKYDVTVAEYREFTQAVGRQMRLQPYWNKDNQPVVNVDSNDARLYCEWAGKRLPTEAEWEKAARGGTDKRYGAADSERELGDYAWFQVNSSSQTHPVGQKNPNAYGLFDMNGNVWQWTADWYDENYFTKSPAGNPQGPPSGKFRALHGGAWSSGSISLRPADRNALFADYWMDDIGFRCARGGAQEAKIEWVGLLGGTFMMGSEGGGADERPAHRVRVRAFEMAKSEVTVKQYKACVDAGACAAPGTRGLCNWGAAGRENHPVNCVDWFEAKTFSEWAGGRLPTEAEWEYAARSAGKDRKYPWGNEAATCGKAVMAGCGQLSTWPACFKPGGNTEQGLCDMAGNVWEWTQDWYHGSYNGAPSDGSAWESPAGSVRVLRGGSWNSGAGSARAASRNDGGPGSRNGRLGFRPSRSQ